MLFILLCDSILSNTFIWYYRSFVEINSCIILLLVGTCGSEEHWAHKCQNKFKKPGQSVNMIVSNSENGAFGYGNLFTVFSVCQSTNWWIDTGANIHVCSDISLFSSYKVTWNRSVSMGNGASASVLGVGMVDMKFTSGRIV